MQVLVIGGGTMGAGIAHVLAAAGHSVRLVEADPAVAGAARQRLARLVAHEARRVTTPEAEGAAAHEPLAPPAAAHEPLAPPAHEWVRVVVGIPEDAADGSEAADLVIEAVFEDEALKRRVLAEAEARVPASAVLASNTSSLSVGALAEGLQRPERFLGMHFFNPVPRSALVELVTGPATAGATVDRARRLVRDLGKEEIVVRDSPGFATSRLGVAAGLEAIRMLEAGVATAEDIDRGMVLGYRHPMGPLRLTDLVGLDVRLAIAEYLERTPAGKEVRTWLLRLVPSQGCRRLSAATSRASEC